MECFFLEIGHTQRKDLMNYLKSKRFSQIKIYKDLSKNDRCLVSTKYQ